MSLKYGQTVLDRFAALTTIKGHATVTLDLIGAFGAAAGRLVDFCRIDIIANAMDHEAYIVQLRMIVNFNKW